MKKQVALFNLLIGTIGLFALIPVAFAAPSCANPPPTSASPGAACDITLGCFTITKGTTKTEVRLPQKPCAGNYVCRNTNDKGIGTCKCAFGSFEMPFLDKQKTLDVCQFISNGSSKPNAFNALVLILNEIANYLTAVIVAVGLVVITFGGYRYMTAGGDGNKISSAKTIIATALIGITLAMLAWLILNTISPQFTNPPNPLP